ncbi:MAG: glycogen/starch/alpha-glucan phosphorylase [Dehalococcoidia bacterium]|nr:MAG: glycogen/starch/alpha-glucan phosphorylase [Dehalococcoidia bacterium]
MSRREPSASSQSLRSSSDVRTGLTREAIARALIDNLYYIQGRVPQTASGNDWYMALAHTVRDRVLQRWMSTTETYMQCDVKSLSYLSAEFLMGPHLGNALVNLGVFDETREAVASLGQDIDKLLEQEEEPGLGAGGLGRLAACFLDSLATHEFLAVGYGIRYEFGIFDQKIADGWQVEVSDKWLRLGNPWEIPRPEINFTVNFGGYTDSFLDAEGRYCVRWSPLRVVRGVAYDTPIPGYRVNTVNLLRLWKAKAIESFDLQAFNIGDYYGSVEDKIASENLTKVLYPNDEPMEGKRLRLEQQYFFVSCSLQDMIRVHLRKGNKLHDFHKSFAVQLNDTHPSIAVPELMRLLVDEHMMDWETAWNITRKTFSFTNHTLLPEALERWPLALFSGTLPRHIEIIYEINRRFLEDVRRQYPGDEKRAANLSLIDESGERYVRMAHLACVGSHVINGVAAMHTDLLKRDALHYFHEFYPDKFINITNGVTPRRWIVLCNPSLARLISSRIGDRWIRHMDTELVKLAVYADDRDFQDAWRQVKRDNKIRLASIIREQTGMLVDPDSLFDIQMKRIHEYKRQHLNVLHVLTLYDRIKNQALVPATPRTVVFSGKAAPGYSMAKLIIKMIHSTADLVNNDPDVRDWVRVVFLPNFNVKNAQPVYPAADLSEQISTAGKEASGTGNMKFSMNGALTIGTLDGANVEIREAVGADNFFLFGLTSEEVQDLRRHVYKPMEYYQTNKHLRATIDIIADGLLKKGDRNLFKPLVESLLKIDDYMVLADYESYVHSQDEVTTAFKDVAKWTRMSILTAAHMGRFSSDRSIREYCEMIWKLKPVKIEVM